MWPGSNIGLACGALSNVVVVDIDQRKDGFHSIDTWEQSRPDGPIPHTLTALSGGGGKHIFLTYPTDGIPVRNRNNWLPGVDVKSDGGYVILSPSVHISGGSYRWNNWGTSTAPAPSDLLVSIRHGASHTPSQFDITSSSNILEGIPEGERDDTLFKWACRLRRQHNSDSDGGRAAVTALVLQAARASGFPEADALVKVDQAYKQDHNDDVPDWGVVNATGDSLPNLTDLGNKERFIDEFGDDYRYVPEWGWLQWSEDGWRPAPTDEVLHIASKVSDVIRREADGIIDTNMKRRHIRWGMSSESSGHITAVEKLARTDPKIIRPVGGFDSEPMLLACRNGMLDLATGQLRPFRRDDLVTKSTNVVYEPDAKLPAWDAFLKDSLSDDQDLIEYLQRAAGYTLTGSTAQECFFIISGPPASGKSTFIDALLGAVGTYGTTTQSDVFMYRRGRDVATDQLARLAGQRMVGMSEVRAGDRFNEALIKQFTGGDRVTARFLYRDTFEFTPQFKLWIATNHDPISHDDAMFRRIKRVEFTNRVAHGQRDPHLKDILRDPDAGGRAVLAWAVEGAMKFIADGKLHEPAQVTMAVHSYKNEHDEFGQFMNECTTPGAHSSVSLVDVYQQYSQWCGLNHQRAEPRVQFRQTMKERGYKLVRDDQGKEVYDGLTLKAMAMTEHGGMTWQ
jgi:putative DNA primase/helicase